MKIRHGDVAFITGASRGLGRNIAPTLAGRGMNVVLAARSQDGLDAVAAEVRAATDVTGGIVNGFGARGRSVFVRRGKCSSHRCWLTE
jgi:short-subunit dehydrogenase